MENHTSQVRLLTALLLLLVLHYNRWWFPSVECVGVFCFHWQCYGSRKADPRVRAAMITGSKSVFQMTGKWRCSTASFCCLLHLRGNKSGVCWSQIQSQFLAVIDVGLAGSNRGFHCPSRVCIGPSVVFSIRNKLQRACWRMANWLDTEIQGLL